MAWLKDHGITSSYEDYLRLPLGVLQDCNALAWAESTAQRRRAAR
jgi:predicted NBD/HSP70 family sugar kinase